VLALEEALSTKQRRFINGRRHDFDYDSHYQRILWIKIFVNLKKHKKRNAVKVGGNYDKLLVKEG